jgi:hypothetical protein
VLGSVFMFCDLELILGDTEGVGSLFNVSCSQTPFGRYRGSKVLFLCFANSDSFLTVPSVSGPVFMFCAPGLVFYGTEGIRSRFHVLCFRTRFRRYLERRVPFSCFVLPKYFSPVSRASTLVYMFCAFGFVLDGTEGVESSFHVLCSQTRFGRYLVRRDPFSCFELPDSFSAVERKPDTVFMFCASEVVLCGIGSAGSPFHVLRSRTHLRSRIRFQRYRGRRVPFSCFALPDSFWSVLRAPDPVFIFCALGPVLGGTEGARSNFHILRS